MKKVYIAGPYRAATENEVLRNIAKARDAAVKLWKMGYAPFCPHMNSAFMGGIVPDDTFLAADFQWLQHADIVVMLPGWRASQGARAERKLAMQLEIPVVFSPILFVSGEEVAIREGCPE